MNRSLFHQVLGFLPGFTATNNAGRPLPPTPHQLNVQARVVEYLKTYGGIDVLTVNRLGTTSGHKLLSRLRDKGLLASRQ